MDERQQYIQQLLSAGISQQEAEQLAQIKFGAGNIAQAPTVNQPLFPQAGVQTNPQQVPNLFPGATEINSSTIVPSAYTGLGATYAGGSDQQSLDMATGLPINEGQVQNPNVMAEVSQYANLFNPYGVDLETAGYTLGRAIGSNPTTTEGRVGQGLEIAGAAGKLLFGGARSLLSGYSNSQASQRYWEWMQRQKQQQLYTPASQTSNTSSDNRGGVTVNKYGGRIFKMKR